MVSCFPNKSFTGIMDVFTGEKDLTAEDNAMSLLFPFQSAEYKPIGLELTWKITASEGKFISYHVILSAIVNKF